MRPAPSLILFTTLAGAGQGLAVALAVAPALGAAPPAGFTIGGLLLAEALLGAGLAAAFGHLGRPARAWRAAAMWRTSWMSREVIALPAFMAAVAAWALSLRWQPDGPLPPWLAAACVALAVVLWVCTGMVYAAVRCIREWAHGLTLLNHALIGLASGFVLAGALAAVAGQVPLAQALAPWALALTVGAGVARAAALRRNARLAPGSTPQSATGLRMARVVQLASGTTGPDHHTRDFAHGASPAALRRRGAAALLLGFALPAALLAVAAAGATGATGATGAVSAAGATVGAAGTTWAWLAALLLQAPGLAAERWMFLAQATHPQSLYHPGLR